MAFQIDESEKNRSIVMERLFLHFHKIIPDLAVFRGQFEFATRLDQAIVGTVCDLRGWLLDGHKIARIDSDIVEFPVTPWQFFKQRYAPKWFLRRWPVVMEGRTIRVAVHHHFVCPHVAIPTDETSGRFAHFVWMGEMSGQLPEGTSKQREQQTF
jgi:hypothetical protein